MRRRSDFRKVAGVGAVFMTACYLALGAVGYLKLGSNFDLSRPITSVLPYDAWSVTMNGLLFLHCVVAYAVSTQAAGRPVCDSPLGLALDFAACRAFTVLHP